MFYRVGSSLAGEGPLPEVPFPRSPASSPAAGPLCTSPFWVGSCLPHSLGTRPWPKPSRAARLAQGPGHWPWSSATWQAWLSPDLALGGRNTPVAPGALVSAQRGRF